jgi:hypothetical protein
MRRDKNGTRWKWGEGIVNRNILYIHIYNYARLIPDSN